MEKSQHIITDEILRLIRQAITDNRGSKAAFSRSTGISKYQVSKLLGGQKKFVYGDEWAKLCRYFPEIDDRRVRVRGHHNAVNGSVVIDGSRNIESFRTGLMRAIIALNIDAAAKDAVLQVINTYTEEDHHE